MTEINKKNDLAVIPPTNNDGDPYVLPLDIFKEGYTAYNISNWFKGRVGDNGTPFAIRWYSHGRLLNILGMRPFIEGQVGDYTIDDSDPDNPQINMAEDASHVHIVGDVNDTQEGGVAIYRLISQAFPKSGIFYGKIGFMGTQDDGTLVNTGVDIVFKVLAGHMNMLGARQFYVSELEKAWLDLQEKIRQYDQQYSDKIKQQSDQFTKDTQDQTEKFNQETEQALQDLRTKVTNEIQHAEDNLQGVQVTSNTVLDELNRLSQSIGQVQAQIDAGNVVTRKEHHDDIANLQQYLSNQEASMTKTLTGISKSGPYFFANLAELQSLYPNGHDGILVTRDNLHWCYWDSNQKQYIDCGKFTDSNNSDINIDELTAEVTDNKAGIRSNYFGFSAYHDLVSMYNPDADQKLDLTKKILISQVFLYPVLNNFFVNISSITVKPYQEGKLEIGVARSYDGAVKFKTSQIVELTTTDWQTIPLNNLDLRTGDYLTISGPIYYNFQKDGVFCGAIDKVGTTPLTGIHNEENEFGTAKFSFYITTSIPSTSNTEFPSKFLGKTITYQNKEYYDENANWILFDHTDFLVPPAFKDNGFIKTIYYNAPNNGYITLGTANVWQQSPLKARIHNNIKIKVTKGKGKADIYLPFFANDVLIVGGQVCYMQNDKNNLFIGSDDNLKFTAQNIAGDATFVPYGADFNKGVKLNIYFDTEIADYSHNDLIKKEVIDPVFHPIIGKKYACFGDSIWSEQVACIGTMIQKDLNAQMVGNFATGWATCQDWFDSGKNITPITFNVPQNTDTADNVLSNQVRRMLQWTTEKDQIIKWQHPVDGWFNIDGDVGMGLGHTDDIPDVIAIAISTNDGKHDQCGNLNDDTDEVFQQHYKDLTRNSIASALRWAVETLQAAYPNCKIYICTPLQTNGGNSWMSYQNNLKKAEIIKKVGTFCSVPVIDQFSESGLNSQTVVHGTADGIHPTGEMRDLIAAFDARQIEKKY